MYLKLAGMIESQLRDAYARRHEEIGLTQSDVASKLEVNRAAIHNRLHGKANMTTETIANMVWALGHDIDVKIFDPEMRTKVTFSIPNGEDELPSSSVFIEPPEDDDVDQLEYETAS